MSEEPETTAASAPTEASETSAEIPPVVVNLGKVKKKAIKKLERGEGPLLEVLDEVMLAVREELSDELGDRELVPVVMIYRRKEKKPRPLFPL